MKRILVAVVLLAACALPARAQYSVLPYPNPIPMFKGPWDASQGMGMMNQMIQSIDNLLSPLTGGGTTMLVNLSSSGGQPGGLVTISASSTVGANADLGLQPQGNGSIVLFPASNPTSDSGLLQFGNTASWMPARGIATCPGNAPPLSQNSGLYIGPSTSVTGFIQILDWLGRPHWTVSCG